MCVCCTFLFLYLPDDGDLVVVANAVFTQEVKFYHTVVAVQLLVQGDVLHTQRAATDCVCRLTLLLLITSSQRQLWI